MIAQPLPDGQPVVHDRRNWLPPTVNPSIMVASTGSRQRLNGSECRPFNKAAKAGKYAQIGADFFTQDADSDVTNMLHSFHIGIGKSCEGWGIRPLLSNPPRRALAGNSRFQTSPPAA